MVTYRVYQDGVRVGDGLTTPTFTATGVSGETVFWVTEVLGGIEGPWSNLVTAPGVPTHNKPVCVLFSRDGKPVTSTTYVLPAGSVMVTHTLFNMVPGHLYSLTGALEPSARATAAGALVFHTMGTGVPLTVGVQDTGS